MTEQLRLKALPRAEVGGRNPRRLRREGLIPAVLYHQGRPTLSLSLVKTGAEKIFSRLHENQILNLEIEGGDGPPVQLAIIKETQVDRIRGDLLHVDLQAIALDEELTATVPVVADGEAVGVTRDGGTLEHVLREIEIECQASRIPEDVSLDVSALEIGDSLKVSDIRLPEGIRILTEPELIVFTVSAPRLEEEKPEEEEAAAPEVIGEPKAEEETGEGETADK